MKRFLRRSKFLLFLAIAALVAAGCGSSDFAGADVYGPSGEPATVRFYNGPIYTGDGGEPLAAGEVWVEGGAISYVGPSRADAPLFDAEIDLDGNLLLPGFKNAHAHSPMTFLRSYADDLPLDQWLTEQVYPMEAKLTGEDVYHLYQLAVLEYLAGGITAAFDMYPFTDDMARAAADCGFRAVFCSPVNDFLDDVATMEAQYLRLNAFSDLVTFHLGFHAEYTTSEETLRAIADLSRRYDAPVFFHSSETAGEVAGCLARHGLTPTAYFESLGLLDRGGGAYHCVHVTEADLRIMREKGIGIVTNPASNCKLASGIAPVGDMLAAGIEVGIGTDGPASNNALDMFREMYLVASLQRIRNMDAAAIDAGTVLRMATEGSARVMRLGRCTRLAEGMLADCVVIDLKQPNMQPLNDIVKNVVYAGGKHNVLLTMVNGRILYEKGTYYIGRTPESVYERANAIVRRMTGR